ncbi:UNVERIFIED_CONTAM: hypothetical protein Sradi_2517800 [Sesamum radiatum]|uniref:Uncharacterized protein n=1 Tax=Sesamum radiatum TaxID=300843 RepID=A0AAW2SK85_SESRA
MASSPMLSRKGSVATTKVTNQQQSMLTSSHRSSGRRGPEIFGTLNMPRHAALPEKSCETRVTSEKVTKGTS